MKTSVSLTILGAYNVLMGVMCLLMPGDMAVAAIGEANAANPELLEMAVPDILAAGVALFGYFKAK